MSIQNKGFSLIDLSKNKHLDNLAKSKFLRIAQILLILFLLIEIFTDKLSLLFNFGLVAFFVGLTFCVLGFNALCAKYLNQTILVIFWPSRIRNAVLAGRNWIKSIVIGLAIIISSFFLIIVGSQR